jgi:hypothetical protein
VRRAGTVDPGDDLAPERTGGQLRKRQVTNGHVISGGVRARVAVAQQAGKRLPRAVQVAQQRMVTKAALERSRRALLARERPDERRVEVQQHRSTDPGAQLPRPRPRSRDRVAQALQAARVDAVDHAVGSGIRCDRCAQPRRALALPAKISQARATIGKHHRQITQHDPRVMRRHALTRRLHRRRQRLGQPDPVGQADQQRAAGVADDTVSVRRHD